MITKLTSVVNRIWSKFSMKYGAISMKKADTLFMSVVKHPVVFKRPIFYFINYPNPQLSGRDRVERLFLLPVFGPCLILFSNFKTEVSLILNIINKRY